MRTDQPGTLADPALVQSTTGRAAEAATPPSKFDRPAAAAALLATSCGGLLLVLLPWAELELFARGAAQLAGLLSGAPIIRTAEGWMLASHQMPVLVTTACSGTDYFLMVAALLGWRLGRRGKVPIRAGLAGAAIAAPLAIAVNALRIATLAQVHRWFIPLLPDSYAPFLHMLTGVAVFLPALVALHLILEYHGHRQRHPAD